MRYFGRCVELPGRAITNMRDSATAVTRRTFLKHVNRDSLGSLSLTLGYSLHPKQGLTMAGDWHVSYHRGKFRGKNCCFLVWSGIEHIFM